jgi:phosphopantothenoylcysteine decarboxylase / phosphopantothenate---cysteine ligase
MNNDILHPIKVLITAGPTREAIDPVRFVSNHSSGKMGYAIAETFLGYGASVTLVSGPVALQLQHPHLTNVQVNTAAEMYLACCKYFESADIAVFAAAVADYRPEKMAAQKIKKHEDSFTIKMIKNTDIAYEFGKIRNNRQVAVGFALETNNGMNHAIGKLIKKNFDMVVLNSTNDANAGFGYDTNKITIIKRDRTVLNFPLKSKQAVARDIVAAATACLKDNRKRFEESLLAYESMYW